MTLNKEIKLTNSDLVVLVDEKDYGTLSKFRWFFDRGYARCVNNNKYMHRLIMNVANKNWVNKQVDHINHDGLDNQKINLRVCSNKENHRNTLIHRVNKTGYKGVSFSTSNKLKPYEAKIRVDGIKKYLGHFSSSKSAAFAYNVAAKYYFGQFALLNSERSPNKTA